MPANSYPYYLAGAARMPNRDLAVRDKFTGATLSHVALATQGDLIEALDAARRAVPALLALPSAEREAVAVSLGRLTERRSREFAEILAGETGRPLRACREDVYRFAEALRTLSDSATPWQRYVVEGRVLTPDPQRPWLLAPSEHTAMATLGRFLSVALRRGAPVILCPATTAPLVSLLLGSLLDLLDLPTGTYSVLPLDGHALRGFSPSDFGLLALPSVAAATLGASDRTLTLHDERPLAVVAAPDASADDVLPAIRSHVFRARPHAVGPCLVPSAILATVRDRAVAFAESLECGSPVVRGTSLSPLPSLAVAEAVDRWLERAEKLGATVHCGGRRQGVMMAPTVVEFARDHADAMRPPPGAPILPLAPAPSFTRALRHATHGLEPVRIVVVSGDRNRVRHAWESSGVAQVLVANTVGDLIATRAPVHAPAAAPATRSASR